jgi:HlyD family secretion protein
MGRTEPMSIGDPTRRMTVGGTALGLAVLLAIAPLRAWGADAATEPQAAAVSVTKAKKTCFDNAIEITGVLVPREEVLVRPPREGLQVTRVMVEPGAKVNVGQALAELTPLEGQPGPTDPVTVQASVFGTIARSNAIVGVTASARAEPLFQIVARGELEFSAQLPAKALARITAALPAKVRIVGVGELAGRVRSVPTTVDSVTQLGEVRITMRVDDRLKPGTLGRAVIDAGQRCDRVAVPLSALLYGPQGPVVQIVRDARIETRSVTTGLQSKGAAEIRQGIAEGDVVVARAGAFLRDGDRVRPIAEPGSE